MKSLFIFSAVKNKRENYTRQVTLSSSYEIPPSLTHSPGLLFISQFRWKWKWIWFQHTDTIRPPLKKYTWAGSKREKQPHGLNKSHKLNNENEEKEIFAWRERTLWRAWGRSEHNNNNNNMLIVCYWELLEFLSSSVI